MDQSYYRYSFAEIGGRFWQDLVLYPGRAIDMQVLHFQVLYIFFEMI
jgi:hypothetical protein